MPKHSLLLASLEARAPRPYSSVSRSEARETRALPGLFLIICFMVPSISLETALAQQGVQSADVFEASMQPLPLTGPPRVYEAGHTVVTERKDAAILKEAGLTRLRQQNVVVSGRRHPIELYEFVDVAGAYSFFLGGSGGGTRTRLRQQNVVVSGRRYPIETYEFADVIGAYSFLGGSGGGTLLAEGSMIRGADGSILCWRQAYVLRVHVPASVSVAVVDAVVTLGRLWAETIGETAPVPVMVRHLPPDRLLSGTVRYELGVAGLGRHVEAELLGQFGMEKNVEAAVGDYQGGGRLVLLGYPTAALARQYHERLKQFIQGYPVHAGVKRAGIIVAVASGMDPDTTRQVLERVQYAPSVKWIYKKEDDSTYLRRLAEREASGVMGTVVTAILFTLLFCGITALGGLSVGVVLYWANEHYPNWGGRLQRIERIQLHLDRAANTGSSERQ